MKITGKNAVVHGKCILCVSLQFNSIIFLSQSTMAELPSLKVEKETRGEV